MLPSQRALFDVPRDICYLNSASYSPLPMRTLEAGRAAVGRKGRPWTLDAGFANHQHDRARTAAARLIHAEPADIALIPSISYGVATAAKILTIRARHARPRAGKRSLLAGAGMACAGRGAGLYRRDDPPARRRRLDLGGALRHRTTRRAAGQPRLDLIGALVGRRPDRCRKGRAALRQQGAALPDRRDAERRRTAAGRTGISIRIS